MESSRSMMLPKKHLRTISQCGPYGEGNPRPHFLFREVPIVEATLFGKTGNHVKVIMQTKTGTITAIKFFSDEKPTGSTTSFIGLVEESFFLGRRELRIRIHSFV